MKNLIKKFFGKKNSAQSKPIGTFNSRRESTINTTDDITSTLLFMEMSSNSWGGGTSTSETHSSGFSSGFGGGDFGGGGSSSSWSDSGSCDSGSSDSSSSFCD